MKKTSLLASPTGRSLVTVLATTFACSAGDRHSASKALDATAPAASADADTDPPDPPDVALGHRLFLETRFAQYFYAHASADINTPLAVGDASVGVQQLLNGTIPGAYAGQSMNCGSCHLVEEQRYAPGGSMRSYADFARRSPIPAREDGRTTTTRNTPTMVNSFITHDGAFFLHYDGQFTTPEDLVRTTLLGRNFGWMPDEQQVALHHIARIIREDNGTGPLKQRFPNTYKQIFAGTDPSIPAIFVLPPEERFDVSTATDQQILDQIAKFETIYGQSLVYTRDNNNNYNGSPFDAFVAKNKLPQLPNAGESNLAYARRFRAALQTLSQPQFVTNADGQFTYQKQDFVFGPTELAGLKIFLAEAGDASSPGVSTGQCVACHTPPDFTDFKFHNTGASQEEYDAVHGRGTFAKLKVPGLDERARQAALYLPLSNAQPRAVGLFFSVPELADPRKVDLGLWNVYANTDLSVSSTDPLQTLLCDALKAEQGASAQCQPQVLLDRAIALVKTPSVRDLGQSDPYLHTGQMDTIEDVLRFYLRSSALQRSGLLRNGDPLLAKIRLSAADIAPLTAFLKSLNENYH